MEVEVIQELKSVKVRTDAQRIALMPGFSAKQMMQVQKPDPSESTVALRALNVEQFVEARAFEISSMEKALTNSTEFTGNQRIFQTLPRHMRRRAASYNVKRLPQRLRQRAVDQLEGDVEEITVALATVTDPTIDALARKLCLAGERQGLLNLYNYKKFPSGLICPSTFLWEPSNSKQRKIWIWIHPSALAEAEISLASAIAGTSISLNFIQNDLQRFELMGPRSHAILFDVLGVEETDEYSSKVWHELKHLRVSSSLPEGVVLSLLAKDPRLKGAAKVPIRVAEVPDKDAESIKKHSLEWPSGLSASPLWNPEHRKAIIDSKLPDKAINDLKSKLLIPGSEIKIDNPTVPVLLVQRQPYSGKADGRHAEFEAGWDIIIPSNWAILFWRSFVFAGARVGGLRERRGLYFEAGIPCFPYDFPETLAYQNWAAMVGEEDRAAWERKPKAKRVNFLKHGVEDPFLSPFYKLAQLKGKLLAQDVAKDYMDMSQEAGKAMDVVKTDLNPFETVTVLSSSKFPFPIKFDLEASFVRVHLEFLVKGTTCERAIIYSPVEGDLEFWTDTIAKKEAIGTEEPASRLDEFPPPDRIIGYVTSGHYTFSEGSSTAIGCCRISGLQKSFYMSAKKAKPGKNGVRNMVLVRSVTGRVCWPAKFTIIC
ncbi:hypothetical protein HDU97_001627 [Phlyctochytrium planicorne]|nr:hypothetical protein HDU97_001627 [Phlyctochytrium planicorne]